MDEKKYHVSSNPHVRDSVSTTQVMLAVVIALLPATVFGIAGINYGLIMDCHSSGNIEGYQCVGGVVGRNDGEVYRSDSECIIDGEFAVGGIIGESFGYVSPYDTDDSGDYDKIKFYGKVEGVETDDPYDVSSDNKSIYIGSSGDRIDVLAFFRLLWQQDGCFGHFSDAVTTGWMSMRTQPKSGEIEHGFRTD